MIENIIYLNPNGFPVNSEFENVVSDSPYLDVSGLEDSGAIIFHGSMGYKVDREKLASKKIICLNVNDYGMLGNPIEHMSPEQVSYILTEEARLFCDTASLDLCGQIIDSACREAYNKSTLGNGDYWCLSAISKELYLYDSENNAVYNTCRRIALDIANFYTNIGFDSLFSKIADGAVLITNDGVEGMGNRFHVFRLFFLEAVYQYFKVRPGCNVRLFVDFDMDDFDKYYSFEKNMQQHFQIRLASHSDEPVPFKKRSHIQLIRDLNI